MTHQHNRVTPRPAGGTARRSEVEIDQALGAARRMAVTAEPDDGPFAELAATYVALGELLESWQRNEFADGAQEYESQCADLTERLHALGAAQARHAEQRAAAWTAAAILPRRAGVR